MKRLSHRERMFLNFLYNTSRRLEPTLDVSYGARYSFAEDVFGVKPDTAKVILEELSGAGYLKRELCNIILKCPDCGHYWLLLRLHCPYCNSPRLKKGEAIKHYKCGHVGFKSEFMEEDEYICPGCKSKLEKLGTEYRLIGTWYMCHDCGEMFGEPKEMLLCNDCQKEFERDELVLEGLPRYMLNEASVKEVLFELNLEKIIEAFEDEWEISIPARFVGMSGVSHMFSGSIVSKGLLRRKILFDIEYDSEAVGPDAVMRFFAKTVDVKSDLSILIGIPKFALEAKELAKTYKINVLEGENIESVLKELVETIKP